MDGIGIGFWVVAFSLTGFFFALMIALWFRSERDRYRSMHTNAMARVTQLSEWLQRERYGRVRGRSGT